MKFENAILNINNTIFWNVLFILTGVLLIGINAHAANDYYVTENFDNISNLSELDPVFDDCTSYTCGDSWEINNYTQLISGQLVISTTSLRYYKQIDSYSDVQQCFDFKLAGVNEFGFYNYAHSYSVGAVEIHDTGGNFKISAVIWYLDGETVNTTEEDIYTGLSYNTYYTLCFDTVYGAGPSVTRWRLDTNDWTEFFDGDPRAVTTDINAHFTFFGASTNLIYLDNFFGFSDTINYDFSLSATEPDFNSVYNQSCIIGNDCKLWFSFNSLAIGWPMYLSYYASSTIPANFIASTTITVTPIWQNYVLVPQVATSQTIKYNLTLIADNNWYVKTGIGIRWFSQEEWDEFIDERHGAHHVYCDEAEVCAGVATSTDFLYGVNCGFRKVICWAFEPTEGSQQYILDSITSVEESFPFNLLFSFNTNMSAAISNAATNDSSIDMFFITKEGEMTSIPVVSSTTARDVLGDEAYDVVETDTRYMIWGLLAFIIVVIIWNLIF